MVVMDKVDPRTKAEQQKIKRRQRRQSVGDGAFSDTAGRARVNRACIPVQAIGARVLESQLPVKENVATAVEANR